MSMSIIERERLAALERAVADLTARLKVIEEKPRAERAARK